MSMTLPAARSAANNIIIQRESEAEIYRNKYLDPITQEPLDKTVMLQCGHSFTKDVQLVQWIRDKKTCPCCRANVSNDMPYNYYANELYQDNQALANKVDGLNSQVDKFSLRNERLHESLVKNGRTAFMMEINKNAQIKDLSEKVEDLTLENGILRNGLELATKENTSLKNEIITLRTDISEIKTCFFELKKNNEALQKIISIPQKPIKTPTAIQKPNVGPLMAIADCIERLIFCKRG